MAIALVDLVTRLQEDIPARDGVPSNAQYERAVKEAVMDFSERAGPEKIAALNVVANVATYDLAADFLKLIELEAIATPDGIINSVGGIIPVSANWEERWTIVDGKITFYPIPTYTLARDYRYKAGWALTGGATYDDLGEREAEIVLLKAAASCLTKLANLYSPEAIDYQQGDVKVNTGTQTLALRAQAELLEKQYLEAVRNYVGQVGRLG